MNRIEVLREYIDDILLNMTGTAERLAAYVHLYGVAQYCALIALRRGENVELAIMAGMLHDIYSCVKIPTLDHAHKGTPMAREILEKLRITTEAETDIICSAIYNHSDKHMTGAPLDEILKDADSFQFWMYNPLIEIIDKDRKARCDKVMSELGIRSTGDE